MYFESGDRAHCACLPKFQHQGSEELRHLTLSREMPIDGAPIDYAPSGSTIELIDFANTLLSSSPSPRISPTESNLSWHPKLTVYRLLVILSTVGLAIAKSATSYLDLTSASITLEWILGVVVFLL